jgi:small subunit ribosomal protein S20
MPITKQAIKRMKQSRANYARNRHYSSHMKSMIKLILDYAKKGDLDKANKILPKVVSAIDVAAKKNLIHKHNASRKKSFVQRALNIKDVKPPKVEPKVAPKAKEEKAEKKTKKTK